MFQGRPGNNDVEYRSNCEILKQVTDMFYHIQLTGRRGSPFEFNGAVVPKTSERETALSAKGAALGLAAVDLAAPGWSNLQVVPNLQVPFFMKYCTVGDEPSQQVQQVPPGDHGCCSHGLASHSRSKHVSLSNF
jgi:hypothetical protein